MESVKKLLLALLLVCLVAPAMLGASGPDKKRAKVGIVPGLTRVQGTFALGVLNELQTVNYYVYGEAEHVLAGRIGLVGSVYAQVGDNVYDLQAKAHHSLFAGLNYHFFEYRPLDVYVGFQPGLGLSRFSSGLGAMPPYRAVPLASASVGIAWYGSFFHFFGQLRGVVGKDNAAESVVSLTELRPAFGLGFNF